MNYSSSGDKQQRLDQKTYEKALKSTFRKVEEYESKKNHLLNLFIRAQNEVLTNGINEAPQAKGRLERRSTAKADMVQGTLYGRDNGYGRALIHMKGESGKASYIQINLGYLTRKRGDGTLTPMDVFAKSSKRLILCTESSLLGRKPVPNEPAYILDMVINPSAGAFKGINSQLSNMYELMPAAEPTIIGQNNFSDQPEWMSQEQLMLQYSDANSIALVNVGGVNPIQVTVFNTSVNMFSCGAHIELPNGGLTSQLKYESKA